MTAVSWGNLEKQAPALARFGRDRLDGKVAYLATIRNSGWPRAHPVTPIIGEGHCFIFVEPNSAKVRDLLNNGHYCLHCGMNDSSGSSGEFQMTGIASQMDDPEIRELAESVCSYRPSARYLLFELKANEVLSTLYRGGRPDRQRWEASMGSCE
ncbi:MAG: pyridoxamine 5'-phosphate oxidase family protein [Pseudomonadales bacterium]